MDEPLARIERQPNLTGRSPAFVDRADFPDPAARRTHAWLRSNGSLSTTQEQAAATATWIDDRDQYVDQYTRPEPKAIENPTAANPHRLVYLSPTLARGVRISGRSSVTLQISADQAEAALGAVLVDYSCSLRIKTPLTPGQKVWVQVPLWTNDYTFLAGHRIGVVLIGSFRDYPSERKTGPVPTYETDVRESRLTLPVVGGRDALGF